MPSQEQTNANENIAAPQNSIQNSEQSSIRGYNLLTLSRQQVATSAAQCDSYTQGVDSVVDNLHLEDEPLDLPPAVAPVTLEDTSREAFALSLRSRATSTLIQTNFASVDYPDYDVDEVMSNSTVSSVSASSYDIDAVTDNRR